MASTHQALVTSSGLKKTGSTTSTTAAASGSTQKKKPKKKATVKKAILTKKVISEQEQLTLKFKAYLPHLIENILLPLCAATVSRQDVSSLDSLLETLAANSGLHLSGSELEHLLGQKGFSLRARIEIVNNETDEVYGKEHQARPYQEDFDVEEEGDTALDEYFKPSPPQVPPLEFQSPVAPHTRIDLTRYLPNPGLPGNGGGVRFANTIDEALQRPITPSH